jgi:hypothetical protein
MKYSALHERFGNGDTSGSNTLRAAAAAERVRHYRRKLRHYRKLLREAERAQAAVPAKQTQMDPDHKQILVWECEGGAIHGNVAQPGTASGSAVSRRPRLRIEVARENFWKRQTDGLSQHGSVQKGNHGREVDE